MGNLNGNIPNVSSVDNNQPENWLSKNRKAKKEWEKKKKKHLLDREMKAHRQCGTDRKRNWTTNKDKGKS